MKRLILLSVLLASTLAAEVCEETEFWKQTVLSGISPQKVSSCGEVVTLRQIALSTKCYSLLHPAVCTFAQANCPGISCGVVFFADTDPIKEAGKVVQSAEGVAKDVIGKGVDTIHHFANHEKAQGKDGLKKTADTATQGVGKVVADGKKALNSLKSGDAIKDPVGEAERVADKTVKGAQKISDKAQNVVLAAVNAGSNTGRFHRDANPVPLAIVVLMLLSMGALFLYVARVAQLRDGYKSIVSRNFEDI